MSAPRKSFVTPKGTELPILNLKGKEYLQVAHRLVWFREQYPDGILKTQMIEKGGEGRDSYAVFRTEVFLNSERGPMMVASAHKKETAGGFADYLEKAETGSVGRALALAGFGTQFASDELDEGDRLADAPVPSAGKAEVVTESVKENTSTTVQVQSGRRPSFRKNVTAATANGDDI